MNFKIEQLFHSLPDAEFFDALPGAGPHLAPRLLVAFGDDRQRFSSAQSMSYIGIAPVKEESGKKRWTHWRWSCLKFLRQTFVEWTDQSRRHCSWANAFYQQQRQAGKSHLNLNINAFRQTNPACRRDIPSLYWPGSFLLLFSSFTSTLKLHLNGPY